VPRLSAPFVKICCIQSLAEARLAMLYGADALGFVSSMPSGPGVIPLADIATIIEELPFGLSSFLLTSWREPAVIIEQQRLCRAGAIQLCQTLEPEGYGMLRRALPGVRLVQVIHVTGKEALAQARELAHEVDALLLDSGRPDAATPELGGTGRTHDWDLSRKIRESVPRPVILAGGLDHANVAEAFRRVRPYGVDVCTGVRADGQLDEDRLGLFMAAIRELREGPQPGR